MHRKSFHSYLTHMCAILPCLLIIAAGCASTAGKRGRMQPYLVKTVTITGNASLSTKDLLDRMDTKPGGPFHTVPFSQSLLNADLDAIAYWYRDRGFLDARVASAGVSKDPLSRRVTVNIRIIEGPQTLVDTVVIQGRTVYDEAFIKKIISARPHVPYSATKLSADQQVICDSLTARGYLLCTVERKDGMDSVAHTVSVIFVVDQGPLVLTGSLEVAGVKKVHDIIVKKNLTFHPGDTLTTAQMRMSVRQLYETGMFKYVQITTTVADSAPLRATAGPVSLPVVITVEESDFFKIQGGVGYGTYEGVRLSLQTSYGNVRGLGRTIGLDGKFTQYVQGAHLHYTIPWIFLLPPTAQAEVYGEHHNEATFTGYLEGTELSLSKKTPWNFGYRAYTAFEWVNGVTIQPTQPALGPMIHGNNTQSFGSSFTFDNRDNIFDPTKGLLAFSDAEVAGLIGTGTNHFYKFMIDVRACAPVTKFLVAATAVTAGYVNGYGVDKETVPPQELLYAGSERIRLMRGYSPGSVGDASGGRLALVLNVVELRFTIVHWLVIAGFADAGYVWTAAPLFAVHDLCWTAGPGLRFRTPVGLLGTDLGIRLNGPTKGVFGFSLGIGQPF